MNTFTVKAKLPSLNEFISAMNNHRYNGYRFKQEIEELIGWEIRQALTKGTLKPTTKPCKVNFYWHEKTAKRDCDNIASAKKFLLDAMQKQGIIQNDNQRYIRGFTDTFVKDTVDYVIVELVEC